MWSLAMKYLSSIESYIAKEKIPFISSKKFLPFSLYNANMTSQSELVLKEYLFFKFFLISL